jgi:hypothetical protein
MKYLIVSIWVVLVVWLVLNLIISCIPLSYLRPDEWYGEKMTTRQESGASYQAHLKTKENFFWSLVMRFLSIYKP